MNKEDILYKYFKEEKIGKVKLFAHLNINSKKGQILFVGSSLMEQFPVNEIQQKYNLGKIIYNRGIGGFTIPEMLDAIEEQIFELEPAVIFLNIGTNDISAPEWSKAKFEEDYGKLLRLIKERLPKTRVFLMKYYPVNEEVAESMPGDGYIKAVRNRIERMDIANNVVRDLAQNYGYRYIDVNAGIMNENGQVKKELSKDGIHMWPEAYEIIFENMKSYILE
ncbi:GDSL-type esterase/lipase family protein [Pseudobutyrivibrio xylanivorans]|uniref:Lysophospholipase n=1 Tax=Pseudobutyrivibrio xylanivorans TaxID=185007 RepID=A0A5P6VRK3_PSEXY|nr:GDSL-type esterase/lipase family protein [Pseudobutyrivibrio xylanivorans]QFJ54329.1 lysophospholipase [Pseudobutyrivibrio xylanivorans]